MNLYQQQLDRWKAHLEELYEDLAQATFSVQAAEMRDAYGVSHRIHPDRICRLTLSRCLQTDTIEFVLEAERRMNRAAESAELCQQEGLQEHDEVKKRIDASRQRYWELMATSFNKLTQGNDREREDIFLTPEPFQSEINSLLTTLCSPRRGPSTRGRRWQFTPATGGFGLQFSCVQAHVFCPPSAVIAVAALQLRPHLAPPNLANDANDDMY